MGNTCRYCVQNPEPDLHFVMNRLKPLHPREFYNDKTFALSQHLGEYRFYFRPSELPEKPTTEPQQVGPIIENDETKYYGEFVNNQKQGQGRQIWPDFTIYEGYWLADLPHGKGRMIHPNGEVYEGDWVSGRMQGKGTLKGPNGTAYTGDWKEDRPHGKGT